MKQLLPKDLYKYRIAPYINHFGAVAPNHWMAAYARDLLRDKIDALPASFDRTMFRYSNQVRKETVEI